MNGIENPAFGRRRKGGQLAESHLRLACDKHKSTSRLVQKTQQAFPRSQRTVPQSSLQGINEVTYTGKLLRALLPLAANETDRDEATTDHYHT